MLDEAIHTLLRCLISDEIIWRSTARSTISRRNAATPNGASRTHRTTSSRSARECFWRTDT